MRRLTVSAAALGLGLLAGCGTTGTAVTTSTTSATSTTGATSTNGATGTTGATDTDSLVENAVADCMKAKGFQYIPHPVDYGNTNQQGTYAGLNSVLEAPDQVKTWREKYGFGLFSQLVYPNDPAVGEAKTTVNPNNAIREALDPARQKAYMFALTGNFKSGITAKKGQKPDMGCAGEAALKYYGTGESKAQQAAEARDYARFQNDPGVVAAARTYAGCLRGKGYQVTSAQPGQVEQTLYVQAGDVFQNAGKIDAATAKSRLATEIKQALDDLDCRTGYATLVRTNWSAIVRAGSGAG